MHIEGYGDFPFEMGDVFVDDEGNLCVLCAANYHHCGYWQLTGEEGTPTYYTRRTDKDFGVLKRVGHVEQEALDALLQKERE